MSLHVQLKLGGGAAQITSEGRLKSLGITGTVRAAPPPPLSAHAYAAYKTQTCLLFSEIFPPGPHHPDTEQATYPPALAVVSPPPPSCRDSPILDTFLQGS